MNSHPSRPSPSPVSAVPRWLTFLARRAALATVAGGTALAAGAPASADAADRAWVAVAALQRSAAEVQVKRLPGLVAANRTEAARVRTEREARARQQRETAEAAREFVRRHAQHARAPEARKLAVLADLEGITPWDAAHERAALTAAAAFRADRDRPVPDRFAVAHAVESREITRRTLGRPWYGQPVLAEAMLDRLGGEFGERPELWSGYLTLALHASCDAGREVAYRVVQAAGAPEPTKVAARRLLSRYALVRQPLDFPLAPAQGRPTTLAALAGRTTIVCLWDGTRQPAGPPGLAEFKRNPRPRHQLGVRFARHAGRPAGGQGAPAGCHGAAGHALRGAARLAESAGGKAPPHPAAVRVCAR